MPTTLIRNFPSAASSPDATDFLPLDGSAFGTRKWSAAKFQNVGTADSPTFASVSDSKGNVRLITQNAQTTSYTLVSSDTGKHISTTAGVIVPSGLFSAGDCISIFNNSASSITITTSAVTCYLAGTATTGNRTLAQRGVATLLCVASNTFVITGAGIT
jgi:hypothetical protein